MVKRGVKYKGIFPAVFNKIKKQAKERKIEFNITIEYIGDLFEKQKKQCALTGIALTLKKHTKDNSQTASLDRKNNRFGYVEGNVWWVHKRVNKLKSNFDQEEFLNLCESVTTHKVDGQIEKFTSLLEKIKNKNGT